MSTAPNDTRKMLVPPRNWETQSAHGFCPIGGMFGSSSTDFSNEVRCLLATRLRAAVLLLLGGFTAFLLRYPFIVIPGKADFVIPHTAVVVVLAGLAVLLFRNRGLSLGRLRVVELVVFGVPAAFFVWMQYLKVYHCPGELREHLAGAFPGETVIPWLILVQLYGFFIPNTWQRSAAVILAMCAAPLITAWAGGSYCPYVHAALMNGGLSSMFLWMGIGAAVSTYGTHRFGRLRREAFEAKRFGVYTLRERLGSGGMGDVYVAEHQLLKRRCAIKLIKAEKAGDPNTIARFESEVQSAARLTHPNTIEIYDYGVTRDGTFYYVMEYLPGLNLQEIVERYGPLPPERVVHLLTQVCSALGEAHAAGLIHRDIKPGNIFAAERGGLYDFAKLLDFGLVKSLKPDADAIHLTQQGSVVGSPLFAAPEAAVDGEPTSQSDIYSIGATAYYLLTGRAVFPGDNALKVLFAHAQEQPQPLSIHLPDVPRDLEAVIMKCLAKKPEDRFATVGDLEHALETCRLPREWTQANAKDWWSSTPEEHRPADGEPESDETAVTAVMNVPG
jgi:eukaryotic-like serine/threonine-protein kinase